jgi:hypothetical protein
VAKVERHDYYTQEQLDNPDDWSAPIPGIRITMNRVEARKFVDRFSYTVSLDDSTDLVRLFLDLREALNERD